VLKNTDLLEHNGATFFEGFWGNISNSMLKGHFSMRAGHLIFKCTRISLIAVFEGHFMQLFTIYSLYSQISMTCDKYNGAIFFEGFWGGISNSMLKDHFSMKAGRLIFKC
jgi:hypothetical protein